MLRVKGYQRCIPRLLLAVGLAASLGGCGATVIGKPDAAPPPPSATVPPAPIQWSRCEATAELTADTECAMLQVPVDYSKPGDAAAHIALIRFPATGRRIGSLVINPGGPGGSGIDAAAGLVDSLPKQIRQRFDLVGFDPRGVGLSTPAIRCNTDEQNDAARADPQVDYSPAGIEHIESTEKDFARRCLENTGEEFLANVGTVNVARDLDMLRGALGEPKLTYLGYSYGTLIGSAYAEEFGANVRAMILDGAVDPTVDPVDSNVAQSASFQKAFNDYAADCAKSAACPLGTDPAKAVDVYRTLVDPLVTAPAPTADPRGLGYSDAVTATMDAMYSPSLWPDLTKGLSELAKGHGDGLLVLADSYLNRDAHGHYNNSGDAETAINCVDQPPITDRARAADQDRRAREAAPFMSYGQFTGNAPLDTCAFWPVPSTSTPHKPVVSGLPPVLVVSTTDDPATPYQAGVDLAEELGGALLTFQGTQHTVVFEGNTCIDGYAEKYLIDLTLPPQGARC